LTNLNTSFGQALSKLEAISYLDMLLNKDLESVDNIYSGKKKIEIRTLEREILIRYRWLNNEQVLYEGYQEEGKDFNEISFDVTKVGQSFASNDLVRLKCEDSSKNCFHLETEAIKQHFTRKYSDRPNAKNHFDFINLFYLNQRTNAIKSSVVLNYLMGIIRDSINNVEDGIYDEILGGTPTRKEMIPLVKKGGVFKLKVSLAGIPVSVILDSGASDVSISKRIKDRLLAQNIIDQSDFLSPALYRIADGSIVEGERFIIPYIKVNDITIEQVKCSVNESSDTILLGESFLEQFKSWKIKNTSKQLILEF